MIVNNETIAEIVADIRAQNQGLPEDSNALSPLVCDLLNLADRIEAIAKRAYNEIDHAVCAIEEAFCYDIDNVREAMNGTIGDYYAGHE